MVIPCIVGLVSVYFMPETAGASLQGEILPGSVGSAVVPGTPAHRALENGKQPEQRGMRTVQMLEVAEQADEAKPHHH